MPQSGITKDRMIMYTDKTINRAFKWLRTLGITIEIPQPFPDDITFVTYFQYQGRRIDDLGAFEYWLLSPRRTKAGLLEAFEKLRHE